MEAPGARGCGSAPWLNRVVERHRVAVPTAKGQSPPGSGWAGGNFGRRRAVKVYCARGCGSGPRWNRGARHHRRQPCRRLCEDCRRSPAGPVSLGRHLETKVLPSREHGSGPWRTGSAVTRIRVRADYSEGGVGRTSPKPDRLMEASGKKCMDSIAPVART